jgi:ankyrin repeat protein
MQISNLEGFIDKDDIESFESVIEGRLRPGDSNATWAADLLDYAIEKGRSRHVDYLSGKGVYDIKMESGMYPANSLSLSFDLKIVAVLFTHGWNPNQVINPKIGNTLLHQASRLAKPEVVAELIKIGADPEKTNLSGESPADIAKRYGNRDLVSFYAELSEKSTFARLERQNASKKQLNFEL